MTTPTTETKAQRKTFDGPSAGTATMSLTPGTASQLQRIATIVAKFREAGEAARIAVAECNHRISDTAGAFIPTPEMEGTVRQAEAAAHAVNQVYLDTLATPDLPDGILIEVLQVRVLEQGGCDKWCAKIRSLGGPRITARWLFRCRHNHMLGMGGRVDPRVRRALILEDAHTQNIR
ncbi:hypothetical protein [Methylorubrum extorquens]|uniref:Uncharacterized protein n=1 Tax=Methylorubrum extorquens TaxID=408 RepID=A0AAX3WKP5_METEX|nr:hypothetical protein [Methylorubrum extorquens]WHQ72037.1 hypothetical protein KEC54_11105 [Methylorubrum extorquens]